MHGHPIMILSLPNVDDRFPVVAIRWSCTAAPEPVEAGSAVTAVCRLGGEEIDEARVLCELKGELR